MTIYLDWLSLPKQEFKVLMFLIDTKKSSFSIESILTYFMKSKDDLNDKDKRRYWEKKIINALTELNKKDLINLSIEGDIISATIKDREKERVEIADESISIKDFQKKGFTVSIDWGVSLRVLFATMFLRNDFYRNDIKTITGINKKTISRALKMLVENFNQVDYTVKRWYLNGWHCDPIHFDISAFGFTRK